MTAALCLAASAVVTLPARAQDRVALRAEAGIGGLVKPGRWVPVRIEIAHRDPSLNTDAVADLVVSWGDATTRRRVFLGSPGTRRYEVYVRANDAGSTVRVALDGLAAPVDVPVTVLPFDERVTLCVADTEPAAGSGPHCSVTLTRAELPTSVRAYEAVDAVLVTSTAAPSGAARVALDQWRSVHALDAAGDLSLTPQVTRPLVERGLPRRTSQVVSTMAILYVALLLVTGSFIATARMRASRAWLVFAGVIATASGAALAIGHVGPGSATRVHYNALLQQIPGTEGALLTMRAVAEFPSNETANLSLPLEEAMIEPAVASGRAEQLVDEAGRPLLMTDAGLGMRRAFAVEGIAAIKWLAVREHGSSIRIENQTTHTLHDCRFADGMSRTAVGDLAPGASVDAIRGADLVGPVFTCTSPHPAVAVSATGREVEMIGITTVAVYQRRDVNAHSPEVPND
jgi:hypothetical protein